MSNYVSIGKGVVTLIFCASDKARTLEETEKIASEYLNNTGSKK